MFGFFVGTACLIGLVAVARRGHHHHHRGHHGRRGWATRFWLRRVMERLDTTPGQEKVIREALHDLQQDARSLRSEVRGTRTELARALRGPELDKALLERVFATHDELIEKLRASWLDTADRVHTPLDEQRRTRLADVIESGGWGYRRC